jgi:hypothetical protein
MELVHLIAVTVARMGKLMTEVRSEDWINGDGMWLAG